MLNQTVVYVIAFNQKNAQHRTKKLLNLRKHFYKLFFVTKNGEVDSPYNIVIGSYPNPFGILRVIGLTNLKKSIDKFFYFPSEKILFVKKAVRNLNARIKNELLHDKKICVITCVPHHDTAIIGLKLKEQFPQIRWIVDWQDLWSYDDYYYHRFRKKDKKKLLILEKAILNTADLNVVTNSNARNILIQDFKVNTHNVTAINHPFDIEDKIGFSNSQKKDDIIRIGFLGNFFKPPKVPGHKILDAFDKLNSSELNFQLHIIGDKSNFVHKSSSELNRRYLFSSPPMDHKASLACLADFNFLLLFLSDLPNCEVIVHAKLPHYLMLRIPIIAIVPENSAVAEIINKTQSGFVIPFDGNIANNLYKILHDYHNNITSIEYNEFEIDKYSWKNISKEWLNAVQKTIKN